MKTNKAPDKIYACFGVFGLIQATEIMATSKDVEYTRTDAFIEKALKWYCLDCECNDNCKDSKCFFHNTYKRYLEGDTNCLPPKFSTAILNEDGSTSDNWRHRHFIKRMQDDFIEKAKKWFEKHNEWFDPNGVRHCDLEDFEDFINYMKGE